MRERPERFQDNYLKSQESRESLVLLSGSRLDTRYRDVSQLELVRLHESRKAQRAPKHNFQITANSVGLRAFYQIKIAIVDRDACKH